MVRGIKQRCGLFVRPSVCLFVPCLVAVQRCILVLYSLRNTNRKPLLPVEPTGLLINCIVPGGSEKYCDEFVCLSVCLSVRSHNSKTTWPNFTNFCGRGSVILWRRCHKLCTSGFVDDVVCSQFTYGSMTSITAENGTEFCSKTKTSKHSR